MIPRSQPCPELVRLATAQAGVLSRAQARAFGVSDKVIARLTAQAYWHRVTSGLYSLTPEPSWEGLAWGGCLLGGEGAVLGGSAAGHLQGIVRQAPAVLEVWVEDRHPRDRACWVFRRGLRFGVGDPPRITVAEAVLDISATLSEDRVAALLAEALSQRRTSPGAILSALARRSRYPHRRLFLEILKDVDAGMHSALERRYAKDVERAHGLPTASRQRRPVGAHRSDAWYAEHGLLVELDGRQFHAGAAAFRDMHRDNDHALRDLVTLRYGWTDVTGRPCAVAAQVAAVLRSRGWFDPLLSCPRCRRSLAP